MAIVFEAYHEITGFSEDKRSQNAHKQGLIMLGQQMGGIRFGKESRAPYNKSSGTPMIKPSFVVEYTKLKNEIEAKMEKMEVSVHMDVREYKEKVVAKIEEWHQKMQDAGWEYRPQTIKALQYGKPTRTAHRNKPGREPAYVVRENGEIIFEHDDLEEINLQIGEAWVGDYEDDDTGKKFQVLHHANGKQFELGDAYMRPHGKMMLEKRFPFYVHDRTQ